ncbi:DUF167 family protein YggU [Photobacterium aquimaris]|uniref:UPF0235 protein C0W81_18995 n=1 Tax=Photobacterium aquimaris TaxID=512643 RepID=A0A2T3HSZ3_9GAMM|nr:DUF167 family protein YggU [Photobacterium aquimaris]OBU18933.1 YggU family protein [Photobacterium aquimaris]PQJ41962.1 YggU family protein [Photobacterium aquimaris]PST97778.1 YggU family protein [Photobacterium aquimaris]
MSANAVCRHGDDVVIRLYIQPKASRDQIVGLHGDEIKISITAPPVDGKANAHLAKFLAKQFKVAKGLVHVEKGFQGRHKQIRIEDPKQIPEPIASLMQ